MNKSLCLVMGIVLFVSVCHAQVYWGIQAGGHLSNTTGITSGGPDDLLSQKRNPLSSLAGGAWGDLRMSDYMDFQPHLLFVRKGTALRAAHGSSETGHVQLSYLELPLNLMYRIPFEYDDLFLGGGAYGAWGLGGHYADLRDSSGAAPDAYSGKVLFDNGSDPATGRSLHLNRWDAGFDAEVSYQCYFGLTFSLHYSLGLVNISPGGPGRMHNQYAGLSVGYLFGYNTKD